MLFGIKVKLISKWERYSDSLLLQWREVSGEAD